MKNLAILNAPANDNSPFVADFQGLPEAFLHAYQAELFGWARRLAQGNQCTVDLWNYPEATVISSNWQGSVILQCDAFAHPITKKMKFVIRPATPADAERIAKHCEELPAIMNAHRAHAQAKAGQRPKMARWVFDGTVPEYFVLRYQFELREWSRNLGKIGTTKHIVLREGTLAEVSPDPEQGAELLRVELHCKAERLSGDELQIVVYADERNEWLIRRHCEKMQKAGVPPGAVLVEPERPGLPFMPTVTPIAGPPVGSDG